MRRSLHQEDQRRFAMNEQSDASECLFFLLDCLVEDTNRIIRKPYISVPQQGPNDSDLEMADKTLRLFRSRTDSHVLQYIQSLTKFIICCCRQGCENSAAAGGSISITYSPGNYFELSLPPLPGDDSTVSVKLLDCVNSSFGQTIRNNSYFCRGCSQGNRAVVTESSMTLFWAPPILILKLKRLTIAANRQRTKNQTRVDYPLKGLDLTEHVAYWTNDTKKPIYDLYGVICHEGDATGGVYSCMVQNARHPNEWNHYLDDQVTAIREDERESKIVSSDAYVLFYRRRDAASQLFEQLRSSDLNMIEDLAKLRL